MQREVDHFEQLRRAAFDRGMSDYDRTKADTDPGCEVWKNNPYQNNHATDEKECWNEGFENAKQLDQQGQR